MQRSSTDVDLQIEEVVARRSWVRARFQQIGRERHALVIDSEVYPEKLSGAAWRISRPSRRRRTRVHRIIMAS